MSFMQWGPYVSVADRRRKAQAKIAHDTAKKVFAEKGVTVPYLVGTMIELPRACVVAVFRDQPRARVASRIGREDAVLVGQEHEQARVAELGHEGREHVVVAELDLVDGDRVVLVQDGHRARLEQRAEGGAGVVGARPVGEIGMRQQHLRHGQPARGERLLVGPHEQRLSRGCGGLPASLLARADEVLGIPLYGVNHSLPVAVAAGIVMSEWARRRYAPGVIPVSR